MQQVEEHAYHTYDAFLKEHGEELLALPALKSLSLLPQGDLYLFDEFQTTRVPQERRPQIENLYDVLPSEMTN